MSQTSWEVFPDPAITFLTHLVALWQSQSLTMIVVAFL
jgi:hypothetical protein